MASNRLFMYDPITETAVCIARGFSNGWTTHGNSDYQNEFFEEITEFTGDLSPENPTRLRLHTEDTLPKCKKIIFAPNKEPE